VSAASRGGGI